jgi:hypothetical protein
MAGHKPLLFFTMAAFEQPATKSGWKHSREFIRRDTREKYFTNKKNNTHVMHFLERRFCQKLVVSLPLCRLLPSRANFIPRSCISKHSVTSFASELEDSAILDFQILFFAHRVPKHVNNWETLLAAF